MDIKKMTSAIPASRLLLYVAAAFMLPLLLAYIHFFNVKKSWENVNTQIAYVHSLAETKIQKQSLNNLTKQIFKDTDQLYFSHQLESTLFLKKEREALEKLINTPSFTGNEAAEKRYHFICEGKNRMRFIEAAVESAEGVTETAEVLASPIEIDSQDLKEILFRIEGNRPGKPLLMITDFRLIRKQQSWGSEVFEVNLKLLKREFLQ